MRILVAVLLIMAFPSVTISRVSTSRVSTSAVSSSPVSTPVSTPAPDAGGVLRPPLARLTVLHPFVLPAHPYGPGHRGVDLAAGAGVPVSAAADGQVVYAGPLAGRGVVSLQHAGAVRTTYEPVDATVRAGDRVRAGNVIGAVSSGHQRCGGDVCLHWGARVNGLYVDPLLLLRPLRVRLLPWGPDGAGPWVEPEKKLNAWR